MNKILFIFEIIILFETIILFICLIALYKSYKKEKEDNEKRTLILEQRICEVERLIKMEISGVLNNIDIRDSNYLNYIELCEDRFKAIEKKLKKVKNK